MKRYFSSFFIAFSFYAFFAFCVYYLIANENILIEKIEENKTISLNHIELVQEIKPETKEIIEEVQEKIKEQIKDIVPIVPKKIEKKEKKHKIIKDKKKCSVPFLTSFLFSFCWPVVVIMF